jgi:hypothetical protein
MAVAYVEEVFERMLGELAENSDVNYEFLAVLIDILAQMGFPREKPLDGLDRLPRSQAVLSAFLRTSRVGHRENQNWSAFAQGIETVFCSCADQMRQGRSLHPTDLNCGILWSG